MAAKTRRRVRRPQRRHKTHRALRRAALLAALALLAVLAGFVVQNWGGTGWIPTWAQLYKAVGLTDPASADAMPLEGTAVTVLDVGQGDAVLIAQNNEFCLIDAGDYAHADALLAQLRTAGVPRIDLLVMTHPHADHIGAMLTVVRNFSVGQLLMPDLAVPEQAGAFDPGTLNRLLDACAERGIPTVTAAAVDEFSVGQGNLRVLQAGFVPPAKSSDDGINDASLCLLFTAGSFRFLDTGDAEKDAETALAASGQDLRCTLMKAGHHGSATSNTALLLAAARPRAIAVSCGRNNDYGHPHQAALDRMAAAGAAVYRTDLDGAITFVPAADGLRVATAQTARDGGALLPAA